MNFEWTMDDFWKVAVCMAEDLKEPFGYAAAGVVPALGMAVLWMAAGRWLFGEKWKWKRVGVRFAFCLYVYVCLWQAFFSRESGSRTGVDLILLSTWKASAQAKAYVLENVLMFVPMGTMLPLVWKKGKNPAVCVLTGALSSTLIEMLQLITSRGHCQTDDLVMNTLGTLIGWCLAAVICFLWKKKFRIFEIKK